MKRILSIITTSCISLFAVADESAIFGNWAYDSYQGASQTTNEFKFDKDVVYWGWNGDKYLCNSWYSIVYQGRGAAVPYSSNGPIPSADYLFIKVEVNTSACKDTSALIGSKTKHDSIYMQFKFWDHSQSKNGKTVYSRARITAFDTIGKPVSWRNASNLDNPYVSPY